MPKLLNRLPFPDASTTAVVQGEAIRLRSNQLILWVSLTRRSASSPNPLAVPFPVILDTGFSHTFAIRAQHLIQWAGLRPEVLPRRGAIRDRGTRIPLHEANIWVYPNRRGTRELADGRSPQLVAAREGIAVYPPGDFPRLPILGLRAIAENNLILQVNGPHREATLRTPLRWWPF